MSDQSAPDRAAINRANAQKSSGPVTPEGKFICSRNAVKHGLTGNTVLLDADDVEAYQQRLDDHVAQYKPVTLEERRLVQSIHDSAWRLDRILNHEFAIYAIGRIELQFCFGEAPEDQRKSLIELEIFERNGRKLRNLHIQEARLQRQRAKDIVALKLLIQERQTLERQTCELQPDKDNKVTIETVKTDADHPPVQTNGFSPTDLKQNGFVFENPQFGHSTPLSRDPVQDACALNHAELEEN